MGKCEGRGWEADLALINGRECMAYIGRNVLEESMDWKNDVGMSQRDKFKWRFKETR